MHFLQKWLWKILTPLSDLTDHYLLHQQGHYQDIPDSQPAQVGLLELRARGQREPLVRVALRLRQKEDSGGCEQIHRPPLQRNKSQVIRNSGY